MAGKFVQIRDRPEYAEMQENPKFKSWLLMQDAVMDLEFFVVDDPELKRHGYTRDGLELAEAHLLERYADKKAAFSDENLTLTMRYVYFIGETFRVATEGKWVALPPEPPLRGSVSAIDAPYSTSFYVPQQYLGISLVRRTGTEMTFVYDFAVEDHQKWVDAGRPPRD